MSPTSCQLLYPASLFNKEKYTNQRHRCQPESEVTSGSPDTPSGRCTIRLTRVPRETAFFAGGRRASITSWNWCRRTTSGWEPGTPPRAGWTSSPTFCRVGQCKGSIHGQPGTHLLIDLEYEEFDTLLVTQDSNGCSSRTTMLRATTSTVVSSTLSQLRKILRFASARSTPEAVKRSSSRPASRRKRLVPAVGPSDPPSLAIEGAGPLPKV